MSIANESQHQRCNGIITDVGHIGMIPPIPKLNRTEQVIMFRLRTGHNRLNAHMYNKFKAGESEMCPCTADIMTVEHLLQHCRLHDAMRRDTWPDPTLLRTSCMATWGS